MAISGRHCRPVPSVVKTENAEVWGVAANEYCEDALRRTEEAVAEAYDEIKKSRSRFRAAASAALGIQPSAGGSARPMYDAAADED